MLMVSVTTFPLPIIDICGNIIDWAREISIGARRTSPVSRELVVYKFRSASPVVRRSKV